MIDLKKEREAFDGQFGLPKPDEQFLGEIEPEKAVVILKCFWMGWKARAELA